MELGDEGVKVMVGTGCLSLSVTPYIAITDTSVHPSEAVIRKRTTCGDVNSIETVIYFHHNDINTLQLSSLTY